MRLIKIEVLFTAGVKKSFAVIKSYKRLMKGANSLSAFFFLRNIDQTVTPSRAIKYSFYLQKRVQSVSCKLKTNLNTDTTPH